jgi:hypothetical protein
MLVRTDSRNASSSSASAAESTARADVDADASSALGSSGLDSVDGDKDPVGRDLPLPSPGLCPVSLPRLHLRLAPPPPAIACSIPTPVGAQLPRRCAEGTGNTAGDPPLLQHGILLSPATYRSFL